MHVIGQLRLIQRARCGRSGAKTRQMRVSSVRNSTSISCVKSSVANLSRFGGVSPRLLRLGRCVRDAFSPCARHIPLFPLLACRSLRVAMSLLSSCVAHALDMFMGASTLEQRSALLTHRSETFARESLDDSNKSHIHIARTVRRAPVLICQGDYKRHAREALKIEAACGR